MKVKAIDARRLLTSVLVGKGYRNSSCHHPL